MIPFDPYSLYTTVHVTGALLGAGGAYVSDLIFFQAVKDRVISTRDLKHMRIGSAFVWTGLTLLIVSGVFLFLTNPEAYLQSSKFLTKMFVVLTIFVNGLIFHSVHIPLMQRHAGEHYPSSDEFTRKKKLLSASGAVSLTSWTIAVVLGLSSSIPVSVGTALALYFAFEVGVIVVASVLTKRLF